MKILKPSRAFIFLFAMLLSGACSLIFEEDISTEEVYVIMPVDGTETTVHEQLFWWETIGEALKYNLQIVEGTFTNPHAFVADTNVSGDKFRIDMVPGEYEWRISAWNNYSETDYFYSYLSISDTITADEE
jgi:hypothetical protein